MSREFGLYPDGKEPDAWWGARAIITERRIDIPYDRKSFDGDKTKADDLFAWIESTAIPELDKRVKKYDTKRVVFDSDCGRFHCEAEDRDSGGYLYIGCWTNLSVVAQRGEAVLAVVRAALRESGFDDAFPDDMPPKISDDSVKVYYSFPEGEVQAHNNIIAHLSLVTGGPTQTNIEVLHVDHRFRRKGIGSALVEYAIETAKLAGHEGLAVVPGDTIYDKYQPSSEKVTKEEREAFYMHMGFVPGDPPSFMTMTL